MRHNRAVQFVVEVVDLYFSKRVSRSAAELAYFLILSFFPALICINAVIGALHLSTDAMLASLDGIIPAGALGVLIEYVRYITDNQSAAMLAAGIGMLLFSASAAIRSLMNIMDDIYGRKSYVGIWQIVASVVISVLFLLMFMMLLYKGTAPRGRPHAPVFTGALLASAALVGASAIFSIFIGMSSRYSLVYGSLTSVIILLVWLYLCGTIVILGNIVNRVWYSHKRARALEERERRA